MKKENDKIVKFQRQFHINIGVVIFGIMAIYMIFHVFSYLTAKNITVYEVNQGTIAANQDYQALAVRQESVVTAPASGNIFYFVPDVSRAGVKTGICSIDTTGGINEQLSNDTAEAISSDQLDLSEIASSISSFTGDYSDMDFQKVYSFKSSLTSQIEQLSSQYLLSQLSDQVAAASSAGTFHMIYPQTPGLVLYETDGYENITTDNFTAEDLNFSNVKVTDLKSQEEVSEGQAIYKLVTSDHWNLITEIDETTASQIDEGEYFQIRFKEDQATTWVQCSVVIKEERYFLVMSLHDSLDRYATSRFVRIELLLQEESGLKIPNSAIAEKEFFTIPKAYFYQGNNSSQWGVMVEGKNETSEFVTPTIYYETEDTYYVDSEDLSQGDRLIKPDSQETYTVGDDKAKLKGVYNVNKGYAVFKQIEILYQTKEYTIVKTGTSYGISLYDHIALQGDEVSENEMIY